MGYFANGSEGDAYEARWCRRCVHDPHEGESCPVLDAHQVFNYAQHDDGRLQEVLSLLIPRHPNGGNARCRLFIEAAP